MGTGYLKCGRPYLTRADVFRLQVVVLPVPCGRVERHVVEGEAPVRFPVGTLALLIRWLQGCCEPRLLCSVNRRNVARVKPNQSHGTARRCVFVVRSTLRWRNLVGKSSTDLVRKIPKQRWERWVLISSKHKIVGSVVIDSSIVISNHREQRDHLPNHSNNTVRDEYARMSVQRVP